MDHRFFLDPLGTSFAQESLIRDSDDNTPDKPSGAQQPSPNCFQRKITVDMILPAECRSADQHNSRYDRSQTSYNCGLPSRRIMPELMMNSTKKQNANGLHLALLIADPKSFSNSAWNISLPSASSLWTFPTDNCSSLAKV